MSTESHGIIATATAEIGTANYAVAISTGRHALTSDEPPGNGGADKGPSPFELLLSSLGACTIITLRMYAERKGWPLEGARIELAYHAGEPAAVDRMVTLIGGLDDAQRQRLGEIAEKTPVTRALKTGVAIRTTLRSSR